MARKHIKRKRIYSQPLLNIIEYLEGKDESLHWSILKQITDEQVQAGTLSESDKQVMATLETNHVESLEDLIRVCGIDLDRHIIKKHRIKTSQTPMKLKTKVGEDEDGEPIYEDQPQKVQAFHVKAELEEKVPERGIEEAFDRFVEKAKGYAPQYRDVKPITVEDDSCFAEISIYDLHVGKLSWEPETGANYDTKIAIKRFKEAFYWLAEKALSNGADELIVPLGNDLIHIDNPEGNTTSGTPQDLDGRWQYLISKTEEAFIEALENISKQAKVHVLYIPGNHDEKFSYFITKYLSAWFRNHDNITVDDSPTLTKFYENGVNLIGYNHGKDIKPTAMPQFMATQVPEKWARCDYREIHAGHVHSRRTKGVKVDTFDHEEQGVLYRVLPSLCESDSWHVRKGYTGNVKAAQTLIYNKKRGFEGMYQYNHQY